MALRVEVALEVAEALEEEVAPSEAVEAPSVPSLYLLANCP